MRTIGRTFSATGGFRGRRGRSASRRPWAIVWLSVAAWLTLGALLPVPGAAQEADRSGIDQFMDRLLRADDIPDHRSDTSISVFDEDGELITRTGLAIGLGDTYIAADNRMYEIVGVDEGRAVASFREVVELPDVSSRRRATAESRGSLAAEGSSAGAEGLSAERSSGAEALAAWWTRWWGRGAEPDGGYPVAAFPAQGRRPLVGIYHSHNAESYLETSGTEFAEDGPGDIHEVGATFEKALQDQGVETYHSEKIHLPHDGGAYRRSRATVRELLEKRPMALFDVHRDATPAEHYRTEVDGEPMTKVRLVVGRQNQNRDANLEYAKEIKAVADREFPGLIEGIFHARGNYNQDVGPRTVLLEFGTHETSLEEAEASARLLAQVIPETLGAEAQGRLGASGWRTAGWILLLAVLGVLTYMRINAGSWDAFWGQLAQLLRLKRVGNS